MRLEVLPAAKGDCLLLHHGSAEDPKLVVIDGGPAGVYRKTLRPRLDAIRAERNIGGDDPLTIDLLLVSHIDDDHINGVKALLTDIDSNGAPFKVLRLWHNGFDSLVGLDGEVVVGTPHPVTASLADDVPDDFSGPNAAAEREAWMVLASVKQGVDVLRLARRLHIAVNSEFASGLIVADGEPLSIDGLTVTVLGPRQAEIDALRSDFAEWLRDHPPHQPVTAAFEDDSVPNLSSIVLLVEGEGQRILLTGDARGDKIQESAREMGLLDANGVLCVDVHKVPHHGSDRNVDETYFAMFPAPRFVFSGNGEHGNPERKTFEYLIDGLAGAPATVQLTYPLAEIDEVRAQEKGPSFDPKTDGLTTFLLQQPTLTIEEPAAAGD